MATTSAPTSLPLSRELRERTGSGHSAAERSGFMADVLRGRVTREQHTLYAAQLLPVYEALEAAAAGLAADDVASPFVFPELYRAPSLRADLRFLLDGEPLDSVPVLPEARAYVERVEAAASDPLAFVAHAYTRYLGDLSGGFFLGAKIAETLGLDGADPAGGLSFYLFEQIADPDAFKAEYRSRLDALELTAGGRERLIAESREAYALNTALALAVSA